MMKFLYFINHIMLSVPLTSEQLCPNAEPIKVSLKELRCVLDETWLSNISI